MTFYLERGYNFKHSCGYTLSKFLFCEVFMIYIGIDVSMEKHDCFAMNSNGEILIENFSFSNDSWGFEIFFNSILKLSSDFNNIKIGLEATGHYSNNIHNFLISKGFNTVLINPLQTNLHRKSQTLRKTKTDKLDARYISTLLISANFKSYLLPSYHISRLKSLVRYRFRLIGILTPCKISLSRLITIIFPELHKLVSSIDQKSVLQLMLNFPSPKHIANADFDELCNLMIINSKGKYRETKTHEIQSIAKKSIGSFNEFDLFELQQTISHIIFLQNQLNEIDLKIREIIDSCASPIMTIPGISYTTAAFILAEIGDIHRFESSAQLLAFAGLEPSTYQSGKHESNHSVMVKRGSKYLRWALMQAAHTVCLRDTTFKKFRDKKRAEGKHYFVAMSHVSKKLLRVIFHLLQKNINYEPQTN